MNQTYQPSAEVLTVDLLRVQRESRPSRSCRSTSKHFAKPSSAWCSRR